MTNQETAIEVHREVSSLPAIVDVEQAKAQWDNYLELTKAILDESDYLWTAHFKVQGRDNNFYPRQEHFSTKVDAETCAEEKGGGRVTGQVIKSGAMKLARAFNLEVPNENAMGVPSFQTVGDFIVQTDQAEGFTLTTFLNKDTAATIKASCTLTVTGPGNRSATGSAGCHGEKEHKADMAIITTAWTRAFIRAVLTWIGAGKVMGDEDVAPDFEVPGDGPPEVDKATGEIGGKGQYRTVKHARENGQNVDDQGQGQPPLMNTPPEELERQINDIFPNGEPGDDGEPKNLGDLKMWCQKNGVNWKAFLAKCGVKEVELNSFANWTIRIQEWIDDETLEATPRVAQC